MDRVYNFWKVLHKIQLREFVKNNLPISIGRCPILNAITLSGFLDITWQGKAIFQLVSQPQP